PPPLSSPASLSPSPFPLPFPPRRFPLPFLLPPPYPHLPPRQVLWTYLRSPLWVAGLVLWTYLRSPLWVAGLVIDVGGGLLMLQAVASAPVSIVQPVSTSGLALMALFSHLYLHEPMRLADWTGILLCILGTVAVGVSSENPLPSAPPPQLSLRHLMAFVFWVVLLLVVLEWCATASKAKRKIKDPPLSAGALGADVVEELAAGTQAGAFFGLSAAAVKTGMLLATGGPPVFALLGIAVGVSLSSFGFFCQTRGFKEGRAVVVSTCAAVAAMLTAVAAGMAGLGEDLPTSARLRMWRFLGCASCFNIHATSRSFSLHLPSPFALP
ncbi:unnamed protein product, partial [Closterium sp. Naga37s-1]